MKADLKRVYGVNLRDMRSGEIPIIDVADYAANLPPGSAVWKHHGGWAAVSEETQALLSVQYAVEVGSWQLAGGKGQGPKPPDPPLGIKAQEAAAAKTTNKARAWAKKHLNK